METNGSLGKSYLPPSPHTMVLEGERLLKSHIRGGGGGGGGKRILQRQSVPHILARIVAVRKIMKICVRKKRDSVSARLKLYMRQMITQVL